MQTVETILTGGPKHTSAKICIKKNHVQICPSLVNDFNTLGTDISNVSHSFFFNFCPNGVTFEFRPRMRERVSIKTKDKDLKLKLSQDEIRLRNR